MANGNRKTPAAKVGGSPRDDAEIESRPAVAITVAWMLCVLVTLVAEVIALAASAFSRGNTQPETGPALQVANLFLFVAAVVGILCLALTPVAYRVRRTPPPPAITVAAVVAGTLPIVTMLMQWLL